MKSIRKYMYVAALALSALSFTPSLASAQEAAGTFTLSHTVHWQNAVVPAGKYRFSVASAGPSQMVSLRSLGKDGASFVLMVPDAESSKPTDQSQLFVVSRSSGSYVSMMQLPEFGMTLRFAVPPETTQVAHAVATTAAIAAR
jgi:hypothetical protein